jgi:hypothetical protein
VVINEWIGAKLLRYMELPSPAAVLVGLTPTFLYRMRNGSPHTAEAFLRVESGDHFGSRFPGDPETTAVYDYLPDAVLQRTVNIADFGGVLAFDKWCGNTDARQCIFVRGNVRECLPYHRRLKGKALLAQFVDQGHIFAGPEWDFVDCPRMGAYHQTSVYKDLRGMHQLENWLEKIHEVSPEWLASLCRSIPSNWIENDTTEIDRLLEILYSRRDRVADLILETVRANQGGFPSWTGGRAPRKGVAREMKTLRRDRTLHDVA